jgi:hypothetical protein
MQIFNNFFCSCSTGTVRHLVEIGAVTFGLADNRRTESQHPNSQCTERRSTDSLRNASRSSDS